LLAFVGSDVNLGPLFASDDKAPGSRNTCRGWISGYRQWGDQRDTAAVPGYNYHINSGSLGFDYTFPTKVLLGVSFTSSSAEIDLDRHAGKGAIDSYTGTLYGSYFNDNSFLESALTYGRNRYRNDRYLTIGSIERTAYSKHDGDVLSAQLSGGHSFTFDTWSLSPIATLRFVYLDESAFSESGADSLNLMVQSLKTHSLVSELGARAAYVHTLKYGSLVPELSGSLQYDFGINNRAIRSSFEGSPDISFTTVSRHEDTVGAGVTAGLTFVARGGIAASVKYNGEFRYSYQSHGIMGQLSVAF
jgi:outer membrane autotransporter protein